MSNGTQKPTQSRSSASTAKKPTGTTSKGAAGNRKTSTVKSDSRSSGDKSAPRLTREEQAKLNQIRNEKMARAKAKKKTFSEQYMPYVLGSLGILTLIFFVSFLFSGQVTPGDYWMGPVGYWFGYFFYGLFGCPAFCIPLLLIYLAAFWRKNCREDTVVLRVVLSVILMVLISSVVHVIACYVNPELAEFNVATFYQRGARFAGGGFVGGIIGFLLYHGLKIWGTILVSVLVFPLLIMFLVGVTPAYVASLIKERVEASREAKEERELAEARAEIEREKMEKERESSSSKRRMKEAPVDDEDDDYVPARKPGGRGREEAAKREDDERDTRKPRETVRVDTRTGEVVEDERRSRRGDEDEDEAAYTPVRRRPRDEEDDDEVSTPTRRRPHDEEEEEIPARNTKGRRVVEEDEEAEEDKPRRGQPRKPEAPAHDQYDDEDAEDEEEAEETQEDEGNGRDEIEADDQETLYIPKRSAAKKPQETKKNPPKPSREDKEDDYFAVDDLPEDMESMEIDWDDEEEADEEPAPRQAAGANRRVVSREGERSARDPERIVVVVNRQETAAVTSTTDRHVDGLPEEEVVLPSETAEDNAEESQEYAYPPIDLLIPGPTRYEADEDEIVRNTQTLRSVLESFHIRVKEIACSCGPTITRYEVKPDTGVRVRSIANLVDDIALGLAKSGVRIEAPIPGKAAVGIEVPNDHASTVALRNLIETPEFMNHKSRLAACLGADVAGRPVMMDINKMPHLLVAGTTGSGKSVCINSIIMSILYKAKPDEVKLILIDPKKVEFAVYRDLPHLYCPLISDPKKAAGALNSAVVEMERRFELIEEVGVRNIAGYNEVTAGDPERPPLPQMVIIIDELADLMMTASNEVETAICRLAQKARAAGIHLILGTQRPSVDVITGLIKANVPSRIAFTVSAAVDSRTIIDTVGAEKLIGRGDMLYSPVGSTKPMRVQGTFVSDGEVEKVVTFLKEHNAQIEYDESFMHMIEVEAAKCGQGKKKGGDVGNIEDFSALGGDDEDGKFWAAVEVAVDAEKISTSLLQRRLNLGYGRAAKIIDRMEEMGFVGPADGNKPRKLLITKQDLAEIRLSGRAEGSGDE